MINGLPNKWPHVPKICTILLVLVPANIPAISATNVVDEEAPSIMMQIAISDFGASAAKIALVGRFDLVGAEVINEPLTALTQSKNGLVIDLTGVDFVASIGIRHLAMAARTTARRRGRIVPLGPNSLVTEVFVAAGVAGILSIVQSDDEARAALELRSGPLGEGDGVSMGICRTTEP